MEDLKVDFDSLYNLLETIEYWEGRLFKVEHALNLFRSRVKKEALENKEYWLQGKPPTTSYLNSVIHFTGNTDADEAHITELEEEYALSKSNLTAVKNKLELARDEIRVWQTKSANARKTLVVE